MDKTELRENFFKEVKTDPYTHLITSMCARMWAEGYQQALKDNNLTEEYYRKSFNDRVNYAMEWMTSAKQKAQAEAIIAFAQIGQKLKL